MAAQGLRDMGDGHEKIANPIEAAELRARGKRVIRLSFVVALGATAVAVIAASL